MGEFLYKELSYEIIGVAMDVHNGLGPGFTETVCQGAMERELILRNVPYVSQYHVPVKYKGTIVADYYLDMVADGRIDVELKAVSELLPVHEAQVLAYLRASGLRVGLLFNFGQRRLQTKRIIL